MWDCTSLNSFFCIHPCVKIAWDAMDQCFYTLFAVCVWAEPSTFVPVVSNDSTDGNMQQANWCDRIEGDYEQVNDPVLKFTGYIKWIIFFYSQKEQTDFSQTDGTILTHVALGRWLDGSSIDGITSDSTIGQLSLLSSMRRAKTYSPMKKTLQLLPWNKSSGSDINDAKAAAMLTNLLSSRNSCFCVFFFFFFPTQVCCCRKYYGQTWDVRWTGPACCWLWMKTFLHVLKEFLWSAPSRILFKKMYRCSYWTWNIRGQTLRVLTVPRPVYPCEVMWSPWAYHQCESASCVSSSEHLVLFSVNTCRLPSAISGLFYQGHLKTSRSSSTLILLHLNAPSISSSNQIERGAIKDVTWLKSLIYKNLSNTDALTHSTITYLTN